MEPQAILICFQITWHAIPASIFRHKPLLRWESLRITMICWESEYSFIINCCNQPKLKSKSFSSLLTTDGKTAGISEEALFAAPSNEAEMSWLPHEHLNVTCVLLICFLGKQVSCSDWVNMKSYVYEAFPVVTMKFSMKKSNYQGINPFAFCCLSSMRMIASCESPDKTKRENNISGQIWNRWKGTKNCVYIYI